ncbi:hypothetical protein [Segetibacter aerophilus]|uniref:6-phosphogluconate dehydrogenase n=1 Tax=Segetibacter aerophilus TaxID=670293 RepID=A0A512BB02_9BACT|nr:hypothetical protein [Segetibacter aerophilus]GEO09007.1 hypothetical protein SAE01_15030 [Segetibacter aerophilus]
MAKVVSIVVLILLLVFGGWFYWKYYFTYSDGNRTGLLQKFSRKGNVFKTYEGEMVLNSVISNNASPMTMEKFFFSVEDKNVASKMAGFEGKRVVLHYEEKNGALFWRGDTRYIVDSVSNVVP